MKPIAALQAKDKNDALKYAFAFMKCESLQLKECSFFNPAPKKFDGLHLMPQDMYSVSYSGQVPTWEEFKTKQTHISSPGFACVASIDEKDQQRVNLSVMDSMIMFTCYGNYEKQAKRAFDEIQSIHSTLK